MKKIISGVFATGLVIFSLTNADAQSVCSSLFSESVLTFIPGPRLKSDVFKKDVTLEGVRFEVDRRTAEIKSKSDPRLRATLLDMLSMMTETAFVSGDRKSMVEKGELRLGIPYKEGQSIELEYLGDKRGAESTFRLSKIYFVKANAKELVVDKQPVADDGRTLLTKDFVLLNSGSSGHPNFKKVSVLEKSDIDALIEKVPESRDVLGSVKKAPGYLQGLKDIFNKVSENDAQLILHMANTEKSVKVPTVISGPVLQQMIQWTHILPFMSRLELHRAIENKKTFGVLAKAKVKYQIDYAYDKVIKKQAFKYAIIGALFLAYNEMNRRMTEAQSQKGFATSSLVSDIIIAKSTYTADNIWAFTQVLEALSADKVKNVLLVQQLLERLVEKKSGKEITGTTEDVQKSISDLIAKEQGHKGQASFYLGDSDLNWTPYFEKNVGSSLSQAAYMVGAFEKQGKIALVSIFNPAETTKTEMSEFIIERKAYPELYDSILQNLKLQSLVKLPKAASSN